MNALVRTSRRFVATVLAACLVATTMPLPAQAGMVGTEEVAGDVGAQVGGQFGGQVGGETSRTRLADLLAREDVRRALQARGVDADDARARVDALSDAEAGRLAAGIDALPAGGDVLGVIVTIFLVLLVTDILGLTKVFPFTRSIR